MSEQDDWVARRVEAANEALVNDGLEVAPAVLDVFRELLAAPLQQPLSAENFRLTVERLTVASSGE